MRNWKAGLKRGLALTLTATLISNAVEYYPLRVAAEEAEPKQVTDSGESVSVNDMIPIVKEGDIYTEAADVKKDVSGNVMFQEAEYIEEWISVETSAMPISFFSLDDGNVEMKDSNEVKWIDRLDFTGVEEAKGFYDLLVEGSDNDGENDFLIDDSFYVGDKESVDVITITGEVASEAEILALTQYYFKYAAAVYFAFDRDCPEVFWCSGGVNVGGTYSFRQLDTNRYEYQIVVQLTLKDESKGYDIRATEYQSQETIKQAIVKRDTKVNELVSGAAGKNVVDTLKYFNEKLTTTNEYNTSANLNNIGHDCRECISALEGRIGTDGPVCEAYARALKVLCDKAGIPCTLVDGQARSSASDAGEAHMWNYVQVDGSWYGMDVTWNDPVGGSGGAISGVENEEWLLVGSETEIGGLTFLQSHPVSNLPSSQSPAFVNGPQISATRCAANLTAGTIINKADAEGYVTDYVYSGTAITAPVADNFQTTNTGAAITFAWYEGDFTTEGAVLADSARLDSQPVNAGDYTLVVTAAATESYSAAVLRLKVHVEKAKLPDNVFVGAQYDSGVYDGHERNVTLYIKDGLEGIGEITTYYKKQGTDEWTTEPPVNAGTYSYGGFVAEGTNYKAMDEVELNGQMVIQPRTLTEDCFYFADMDAPGKYYYTNSKIIPEIGAQYGYGLIEGVNYTVEVTNNKFVHNGTDANAPTVTITGIGDNVTGTVTRTFAIEYYPAPTNVLYNGAEAMQDKFYTEAVEVTAPGYQISEIGVSGPFTDSVTYDTPYAAIMNKKLYFKQNETGYITDGVTYRIHLDKQPPKYTRTDSGIKLESGSLWWQTLLQDITYTTYEPQEVTIRAFDDTTGADYGYYYLDTSGSTTALTAEQLDEKVLDGSFVELENTSYNAYFNGTLDLDTDGKYVIYVYTVDGAGNKSDYICSDGIIIDAQPPVVTQNTPTGSNLRDVSADVEVTVSEAGTYYYVLSDTAKTITGLAELKACKDTAGCSYGEMTISAQQAGVQFDLTLTGLNANTQYYLYAMAEDAIGQVSEVKEISFLTCQTLPTVTAPTITGVYGQSIEEMTLNGGSADVAGEWKIVDSNKTDIPDAGITEQEYEIAFVPADTVSYGTVTVAVKAQIAPKSLVDGEGVTISEVAGIYTYTGIEIKPSVVVSAAMSAKGIAVNDTDAALKYTDFTVEYSNNIAAYTIASNIAGFDALTAPAVKITGQGNYTGTVTRYFVIDKANAYISVAQGKESYSKEYGDGAFVLEGITYSNNNTLIYTVTDSKDVNGQSVDNDEVITVSQDGAVTITGTGTAVIILSLPATNNYNAAADRTIQVSIAARAGYTVDTIHKSYLYLRGGSEDISLTELLPADCGEVHYSIQESSVTGGATFTGPPAIVNGRLQYTLSSGEINDTADITVKVESEYYEDIYISVHVQLTDRIPVELQEGSDVTVGNGQLIYGQQLSEMQLHSAVFVEQGTDNVVAGTLSWKEPDVALEAGTAVAIWVFTPVSEVYQPLEGSITIQVAKATPYIAAVPEASAITCGENLGASALIGGRVVYGDGLGGEGSEEAVEGGFMWKNPEVIPGVSDSRRTNYTLVFVPEDTSNYNTAEAVCTIVVNEAENEPNIPEPPVEEEEPNVPEPPAEEEAPNVPEPPVEEEAPNVPEPPVEEETPDVPEPPVEEETPDVPEPPVEEETPNVPELPVIEDTIDVQEAAVARRNEPFIIGDRSKEGWEVILAEAAAASEGERIVINMNGNTIVPGSVIEVIRGRNVSMVFAMGNRITWTVNGQSVTADSVSATDFKIEENTNAIGQDIISRLAGERSSMQISLAHNGNFGFTAVLAISVGDVNAGLYGNLFYYNPATGGIEFMEAREITSDGMAQFTFTHASDYVIVMEQAPMVDSNAKSPKTGDTTDYEKKWNPVWFFVIGAVLFIVGYGAIVTIRKREM